MTQNFQPLDSKPGSRAMWAAVLGTPTIFIIQLVCNFVFTPILCRSGRIWLVHVITAVSLSLAATATILAAREWSRLAKRKPLPTDDTDAVGHAQFVAVAATLVGTFFSSLIFAAGIPPILVDPCQD